MAWAGIINTDLIGPYFFAGNVNTEAYLEMLRNFVLPELNRLGYDPKTIVYQHDGAPAHYSLEVRQFLSENFDVWIGRGVGGFLPWPARSPDLTPLDFFLWGYVDGKLYEIGPNCIQELKEHVQNILNDISTATLERVMEQLLVRMRTCIRVNGKHFEHFIKSLYR